MAFWPHRSHEMTWMERRTRRRPPPAVRVTSAPRSGRLLMSSPARTAADAPHLARARPSGVGASRSTATARPSAGVGVPRRRARRERSLRRRPVRVAAGRVEGGESAPAPSSVVATAVAAARRSTAAAAAPPPKFSLSRAKSSRSQLEQGEIVEVHVAVGVGVAGHSTGVYQDGHGAVVPVGRDQVRLPVAVHIRRCHTPGATVGNGEGDGLGKGPITLVPEHRDEAHPEVVGRDQIGPPIAVDVGRGNRAWITGHRVEGGGCKGKPGGNPGQPKRQVA